MTEQMRRPTVKDVAEAAGVAPMTVSYAFSKPERVAEATRRRVLEVALRLGYRPHSTARALRSGRTGQLGVVIGEHLSYAFEDPQAAQFLAGVADVCVEHGMGMVLIPTHGRPLPNGANGSVTAKADVERVVSAAVDAYVLWTTTTDDPVLSAIAATGRPAAIQGGPDHPGITRIGSDDRAAAAAVATAALGRTPKPDSDSTALPPTILSFPLDHDREAQTFTGGGLPQDLTTIPFPVTAARLAGFRDALTSNGYDWATTVVVTVEQNRRRNGRDAIRKVLEPGDAAPTILLTMSDELALGALDELTSSRHAPTITGWDASAEGLAAGLISVTNPLRQQGRLCATAALDPSAPAGELAWRIVGLNAVE